MNYKLTIFPALEAGNESIELLFETKNEMFAAKNSCADLLLFLQDKARVMEDYSNAFIIMENIDGEWEELEEDDE